MDCTPQPLVASRDEPESEVVKEREDFKVQTQDEANEDYEDGS